ncbi:MAG: hypothetical protein RL533_553 [Pseudomonadota bacterium]
MSEQKPEVKPLTRSEKEAKIKDKAGFVRFMKTLYSLGFYLFYPLMHPFLSLNCSPL